MLTITAKEEVSDVSNNVVHKFTEQHKSTSIFEIKNIHLKVNLIFGENARIYTFESNIKSV